MVAKLCVLTLVAPILACSRGPTPDRQELRPAVSGQVLARLEPGTELPAGFWVTPLSIPGWFRVRYSQDANPIAVARELARLPGVEIAQPNWRYRPDATPNDPNYVDQVAHQITDAEVGWDVTTGASSVVVAVLGSGIQMDHPDLEGNLWTNPSETAGNGIDDDDNDCVDDIHGCDYIDDPTDGDGDPSGGPHETQVAGVVAAEGNNNLGGAGVMWTAALMPVRISYVSDHVARAIRYAVDSGADVINMSFGIYLPQVFGGDSIVNEALEHAETAGVVTVASVGNDSVLMPYYPAAHPLVLGVGGTTNSDGRASFSSAGSWVDCAAPAQGLRTTTDGSQYTAVNGTSFAAPYVAGLAGLLSAAHPGWSAAQIREQILFSGDEISPDYALGYSRVNVGNALTDVRPEPLAHLRRPEDGDVRGRGSIPVVGAAVGDSYVVEWRPATGGSPTSFGSGGETLDDVVGTLDTSSWALGQYEVRLTVTAAANTDVDTISFFLVPPFLPGWPQGTFGEVLEGPTYGDIDGDGSLELLAADAEAPGNLGNWVHSWKVDGSPVLFAPFWHNQPYPHVPAIADVDGNGDIEVVVTTRGSTAGGSIVAWHHDDRDTALWRHTVNRIWGAPAVADLDGDGDVEIIAVEDTGSAGRVHVLDDTGAAKTGWPQTVSAGARSSPVIADFDGDGSFDVAVCTATEEILFHADGNTHAGWPRTVTGAQGEPAAADFDGDGHAELVSVQKTSIEIVAYDGSVLTGWPVTIPDSSSNRVALGDLDGDATPEVVIGLKNGEVRAFHADGSTVSGWPRTTGDEIWAAPAIADLDGDGSTDVVISSTDGSVYAWSASGSPLADFPRHLHGPSYSSPAVGDFDGNGTLDLAVGGGELHWYVYAWDLGAPYDPFTVEWSRARHDEVNTGYLPRRFPLDTNTTGGNVHLSWSAPADISAPAAYAVVRDRIRLSVVTSTSYDDTTVANGNHVYGVVALGDARTVRARSVTVAVQVGGTSDDGGSNDGSGSGDSDNGPVVVGSCGCRTGPTLFVWPSLVLAFSWQNHRRRRRQPHAS